MSARKINSVAIVVKPDSEDALATADELSSWLVANSLTQIGTPQIANGADAARQPVGDADLVVVLGGDGTMIAAARLIGRSDALVLGINHGGLGYLTEFRIEEMFAAISSIVEGDYKIDSRVMLDAELRRGGEVVGSGRVLNDVVIDKAALARIINIEVRLNKLFVNRFRADGLIVATPTGSTAYNLSSGGPIIYPSMNAVVLTPICPFTLTNRPIVVPDDAEIELSLDTEHHGVALNLDGQAGFPMLGGDRVIIRKSETALNLVQPTNRNYFDVLRDKLKWGR
ncbi:MAG: NAD(+)/NADH kinase [Chloracidobacterium sp.]|nr:NAD(+)/NADH kinase [Chloracidobacterium sp.]MCC6825256.1 NAD(+)/NADH kinase [Acidobacteriota bacterium]MCO5332526.1 NAD(+)/NADH kinase [Pyrinomonadaceae bacterium]